MIRMTLSVIMQTATIACARRSLRSMRRDHIPLYILPNPQAIIRRTHYLSHMSRAAPFVRKNPKALVFAQNKDLALPSALFRPYL